MANHELTADFPPELRLGALADCAQTLRTRLWRYLQLLRKWNQAYNLTALTRVEDMVSLHLLDSLSIQSVTHGQRVLDVGTGAGLPGLVLAMACPDQQFVLLDGNQKKIRFVTQAIIELGITNAHAIHARCDQYVPEELFDQAVCRAFGSLLAFYRQAAPLCKPGGELLAMKGFRDAAEQEELHAHGIAAVYQPLLVPGLDATRGLVRIPVT